MNDIEILENYVKELNENKKNHKLAYSTGFGKYWSDFGKAIENLLKRNKDLEQIEKEHKEENGRLREEVKKLEKEILYWKEQAEGYQGLAEQIKEDFENRDRWE